MLFDTGASDAFARNAARLGIDIGTIDAAILSHHHYDHGGGLRKFLGLNDHAPVYLGAPPAGDPTVTLLGFVRKGRTLAPDDFRHEVVVALREGGTLAVLTGCSHNGLLNMVETVAGIGQSVLDQGVETTYTGHCTGSRLEL